MEKISNGESRTNFERQKDKYLKQTEQQGELRQFMQRKNVQVISGYFHLPLK
jgi:hypothetical protein